MSEDDKEKSPGRLIATRLPPKLAAQVEMAAQEELVSIAAFTRRALASAVREPRASRKVV